MILLDTTVLVYCVGVEHPLREPARSFIDGARDGLVQVRTTPEVIQEFAHVRARRRDRNDAVVLAAAFSELMSPLQVVTPEHLSHGLELWRQVPALGAFDAVLAALAIDADVPLVSADRAFGQVPRLQWWDLALGVNGTP